MKRMFFLLYGTISYLIFLGTFCYAVGFVSSMFVPKHIDSEATAPLSIALIMNGALLAVFAVQHSVMARPVFKKWWTHFIPEPIERATYVLLSSLCLILLFWGWEPMGGVIWNVTNEALAIVLKVVSLVGFAIALMSSFLISHFDLFGLRQVWLHFAGKPYEHLPFRTPSLYRYVRHPLYFGFLMAFWSTPFMTAAHLFFAVITTAYILAAIQLEENDLVQAFGKRYIEYKAAAPMILPFVRTRRKKENH